MNKKMNILNAYTYSCKNFESNSKMLVDELNPQLVQDLYNSLIPSVRKGKRFTNLQIHFAMVAQSITYDFIKSLMSLCTGHLADHYFFKRRSVEYLQLYAFLSTHQDSNNLLNEYLDTELTSKFKDKNKRYKKWFANEKKTFNSKFPHLLQAYNNACKYGTHAGLSNQQLSQHWSLDHGGVKCEIQFFDLAVNGSFDKVNPLETAVIQVFRLYIDIFMAIFHYKLTPYDFPQVQYDKFYKTFNPYFESYKEKFDSFKKDSGIA